MARQVLESMPAPQWNILDRIKMFPSTGIGQSRPGLEERGSRQITCYMQGNELKNRHQG